MNDPQQRYTLWARAALLRICERLIEDDVVGRDARADVAWTVPERYLIARVTSEARPREVFWATGGDLPVDYIPASVATGPREAARHFCLRWQLEGARIAGLGKNAAAGQASEWKQVGGSLAEKAELLNDYLRRDEFWGAANLPSSQQVRDAG